MGRGSVERRFEKNCCQRVDGPGSTGMMRRELVEGKVGWEKEVGSEWVRARKEGRWAAAAAALTVSRSTTSARVILRARTRSQ